jgi:hypothetical protein
MLHSFITAHLSIKLYVTVVLFKSLYIVQKNKILPRPVRARVVFMITRSGRH